MTEFKYAEFAFGGVNNRNQIARIDSYFNLNEQADCFRSIFLFNEDIKYYVSRTGSVKGYVGKHIANEIVFDFDGSDLQEVHNEVIKFCLHLYHTYELPWDYLKFHFSGNKGWHVSIPMQCFTSSPEPREDFWKVYKAIANELSEGFRFIDRSIYDVRRLLRLPNTINSKSGLYKIPLDKFELENPSIQELWELAEEPRTIEVYLLDEIPLNPMLNEIYEKWNDYKFNDDHEVHETKTISVLNGVAEGERNNSAIRLTGLFIDRGFDYPMTLEFIKLWNKENKPPLEEKEIESLVKGAFDRYSKKETNQIKVLSLRDAEQAYKEYVKDLDSKKVTLGFPLIDKKLRGIVAGETCCILGKTSVGKSAFLQNIGMHHAKESGEPVLFFSLEMPITSVYERTIQIETGMSGSQVETLYKLSNEAESIAKTEMVFSSLPNFYTVTQSGLTLETIKRTIEFAEQNIYNKKTGLVLIDYLGLVKENGDDIYQQVSKVARGMKDLAKQLNVPIIFLSQVTKKYNEYEELELGAGRDSGVLEEASDFVLGLWKEHDNRHEIDQNEFYLEFGILKNRKGGLGKIRLRMEKKNLQMHEDYC